MKFNKTKDGLPNMEDDLIVLYDDKEGNGLQSYIAHFMSRKDNPTDLKDYYFRIYPEFGPGEWYFYATCNEVEYWICIKDIKKLIDC